MKRLMSTLLGLFIAAAYTLPLLAADNATPAAESKRELISCADLMTHEEREAYRASMRAARTPQEKAEIRQTHRQTMQARARERGLDALECEPLRQRERLRLRGGQP